MTNNQSVCSLCDRFSAFYKFCLVLFVHGQHGSFTFKMARIYIIYSRKQTLSAFQFLRPIHFILFDWEDHWNLTIFNVFNANSLSWEDRNFAGINIDDELLIDLMPDKSPCRLSPGIMECKSCFMNQNDCVFILICSSMFLMFPLLICQYWCRTWQGAEKAISRTSNEPVLRLYTVSVRYISVLE